MNRTDELTAKLLDDTLSDAEWVELESLLAGDASGHAEHLATLELEAVLRGMRAEFDLSHSTMEKVHQAQADRTTTAVLAEIASRPQPRWTVRSRRRRHLVAAGVVLCGIAAALVVGVWLGGLSETDTSPAKPDPTDPVPTYARLTSVLGPVELLDRGGDATPAKAGQVVPPGHMLRTVSEESQAVVEFPDNSTVELDGATTIRFAYDETANNTTQRVFLTQGQLTAAIPEQTTFSSPMVVSTASADVVTRGGRFVVTASGPDSGRVEPKQGRVQVVRANNRKPVSVGVGGAAVILPGFDLVAIESALRVNRTPLRTLPHESHPGMRDVTFGPDGHEVWMGTAKAFVRWLPDGKTTGPSPFYPRRGSDGMIAQFSRDKTALVSMRSDKDIGLTVRNLPNGDARVTIPTHVGDFRSLAVSPAARWVATIDPRPNNRTVRLWDGNSGTERFAWETEEGANCIASSFDGTLLAVGIADPGRGPHNKVAIYDPLSGERRFALPTQRRAVMALAFSPDGRFLAAGYNGLVQLWDVRSRELVRTIRGYERAVLCIAFSPDSEKVAVATPDGQVWAWHAVTGKLAHRIDVGSRGVRSIAFSPDGRSLVTAANNTPLAVWDLNDAES